MSTHLSLSNYIIGGIEKMNWIKSLAINVNHDVSLDLWISNSNISLLESKLINFLQYLNASEHIQLKIGSLPNSVLMPKYDALCGIPAMYLQNVLLTISKGALSTRFSLDINFKNSAGQTSEPYASICLMVLSNTFNDKLGVIVKPVYKELHKENIHFIALSHNTLTASLRLLFLVNWIPKYVYLSEIAMLSVS